MGARRLALVLVLLLVPALVRAGDHKFGAYGAISYLGAKGSWTNVGGVQFSGEATLPRHPKFSAAVEMSAYLVGGGGSGDRDLDQGTFTIVPRYTWGWGQSRRHMTFVELPLGVLARSATSEARGKTAGVVGIGGGYQLIFADRSMAFQVQVDWLEAGSDVKGSLRVSTGFVYRVHRPHPGESSQMSRP